VGGDVPNAPRPYVVDGALIPIRNKYTKEINYLLRVEEWAQGAVVHRNEEYLDSNARLNSFSYRKLEQIRVRRACPSFLSSNLKETD